MPWAACLLLLAAAAPGAHSQATDPECTQATDLGSDISTPFTDASDWFSYANGGTPAVCFKSAGCKSLCSQPGTGSPIAAPDCRDDGQGGALIDQGGPQCQPGFFCSWWWTGGAHSEQKEPIIAVNPARAAGGVLTRMHVFLQGRPEERAQTTRSYGIRARR